MKFTCKGALALLLLAGCTALETKPEFIDVQLTVNSGQTKTTLNDNHFSWTSGDRVGLFAGNIQQNVPMSHVSSNTFEGRFEPVRDDIVQGVQYYAYYPYTASVEGTTVSGRVSSSQVAPFDPANDYIVSSVETGSYNESNLILPTLTLDRHICSIAKIRIQNNNASYASYRLQSVTLSSASENLCGTLTFNPSNGSSSFSGSGKSIVLTYPQANRPTLGNGTLIELNAVLLPCDVHDLSITLTTDHGTATLLSDTLLEFDGNSMVVLPIITGFTLSEGGGGGGGEDPERIPCVFMGDSITAFWASKRTFFADNGFVGKGISGQWTSHMRNRFQNDVINLNPKAVIINGGVNNIAHVYPNGDVEALVDDIKAMAQMAIVAEISPILTTICPTGGQYQRLEAQIMEANALIIAYATANNLPLVDYHAVMVGEDGYMPAELASDGCHPTVAGYAIMEAACLPVINQVIGR